MCKETKPLTGFYKDRASRDSYSCLCKECGKASRRKSWEKHHEKHTYANRERLYQRVYGITHDDYDRMLAEQGGVCKICGGEPMGKGGRYQVDHDHQTGKVRGLLCGRCNRMLGQVNDNVAVLALGIDYLLRA